MPAINRRFSEVKRVQRTSVGGEITHLSGIYVTVNNALYSPLTVPPYKH